MARFDLHRTQGGDLLLDVQSNLITGLGTRLAVPLLPLDAVPTPIRRLHPTFQLGERTYVLATHLMAAVSVRSLGRPVGSLDSHYDRIVAAVDMIFDGF